jgi:hypothetical protein
MVQECRHELGGLELHLEIPLLYVRFEDYLVVYDIESPLDRRRLLVDLGVLVVVLLAMHSESQSLHLSFQRLVLGLLFVLGLSLIFAFFEFFHLFTCEWIRSFTTGWDFKSDCEAASIFL